MEPALITSIVGSQRCHERPLLALSCRFDMSAHPSPSGAKRTLKATLNKLNLSVHPKRDLNSLSVQGVPQGCAKCSGRSSQANLGLPAMVALRSPTVKALIA
jgi:hypothetical protein